MKLTPWLAVAALLAVPSALAHGDEVPPAPDLAAFLTGWSFYPQVVIPMLAAAVAYLAAL